MSEDLRFRFSQSIKEKMFTIKRQKIKDQRKKYVPSTKSGRVPKNNLLATDYTAGQRTTRKLV